MSGLSTPDTSIMDDSTPREQNINTTVTMEQLNELRANIATCLSDNLFKCIRDMEEVSSLLDLLKATFMK